jgi:hypothetical protein
VSCARSMESRRLVTSRKTSAFAGPMVSTRDCVGDYVIASSKFKRKPCLQVWLFLRLPIASCSKKSRRAFFSSPA